MSAQYEALATKARAMYGRRLRRAELARIARLGSVQEVLAELCQQPAWAQAAQALAGEPLVTRARLEDALRGQVRQEGLRLASFLPQKDWPLMDFPVRRAELERILAALRRLHAGLYRETEELPRAYVSRARVDLEKLRQCTDFNGLVDATQGSIFHDALNRLRAGETLPDYGITEALLWSVYYRYTLQLVARRYAGDTRRLLEQSVGSQVDMLNIMNILRMKQYFPEEDDFLPVLLPNHYKVRPEQIRAMCSAPTAQAVMEMVEATPYASAFRGAAPEELQNRYGAVLYQLSRRQLRMGKPSVYTAVAYLNLRELELRAVVSAVETVKYQQDLNPALLEFLDD